MLQSVKEPMAADGTWTATTDSANIVLYLNPSILSALLISLFILSILIFGFMQLFYVQTPEVFVGTSIDFGKIEK